MPRNRTAIQIASLANVALLLPTIPGGIAGCFLVIVMLGPWLIPWS